MNFWNQPVPRSKNPGPKSFKWQDVVGAPGSFQLTLPSPGVALTSWFQIVANTPAIIMCFRQANGRKKTFLRVSPKSCASHVCWCGSVGCLQHSPTGPSSLGLVLIAGVVAGFSTRGSAFSFFPKPHKLCSQSYRVPRASRRETDKHSLHSRWLCSAPGQGFCYHARWRHGYWGR